MPAFSAQVCHSVKHLCVNGLRSCPPIRTRGLTPANPRQAAAATVVPTAILMRHTSGCHGLSRTASDPPGRTRRGGDIVSASCFAKLTRQGNLALRRLRGDVQLTTDGPKPCVLRDCDGMIPLARRGPCAAFKRSLL